MFSNFSFLIATFSLIREKLVFTETSKEQQNFAMLQEGEACVRCCEYLCEVRLAAKIQSAFNHKLKKFLVDFLRLLRSPLNASDKQN